MASDVICGWPEPPDSPDQAGAEGGSVPVGCAGAPAHKPASAVAAKSRLMGLEKIAISRDFRSGLWTLWVIGYRFEDVNNRHLIAIHRRTLSSGAAMKI